MGTRRPGGRSTDVWGQQQAGPGAGAVRSAGDRHPPPGWAGRGESAQCLGSLRHAGERRGDLPGQLSGGTHFGRQPAVRRWRRPSGDPGGIVEVVDAQLPTGMARPLGPQTPGGMARFSSGAGEVSARGRRPALTTEKSRHKQLGWWRSLRRARRAVGSGPGRDQRQVLISGKAGTAGCVLSRGLALLARPDRVRRRRGVRPGGVLRPRES